MMWLEKQFDFIKQLDVLAAAIRINYLSMACWFPFT